MFPRDLSCPASHSLIVQPTRRGLEGRESTDVTLVSFRNIRSVRSVRHSGANVGGRRGAMAFHRAPHVRSKKQDKQTNQQAVFETNRYNSVKHIRISNTAVFTAPSLEYLFEKKGDVCGAEMRSRLGVSPATESTQGDLMGARWWQLRGETRGKLTAKRAGFAWQPTLAIMSGALPAH